MKEVIYQWNNLDRIFKALQIYNNWYCSEQMRDEAFEVLMYEFRDQLWEAWEIDALERWHDEERIEENRWKYDEIQTENDIMLNALTFIEPKWKQTLTEK